MRSSRPGCSWALSELGSLGSLGTWVPDHHSIQMGEQKWQLGSLRLALTTTCFVLCFFRVQIHLHQRAVLVSGFPGL